MTSKEPRNQILHICPSDKFITPFVESIRNNFEFERHMFLIVGGVDRIGLPESRNVRSVHVLPQVISVIRHLNSAQKIILHSIFSVKIVCLLALQPWLLRKCHWVMWGGDLYHYKSRLPGIFSSMYELVRAFVIKRMGYFITVVKGDYELARKWYGATGQHEECLMYQSNLFTTRSATAKNDSTINILVGNSAAVTNNHMALFERLAKFDTENTRIYCPLSYGDSRYAEEVARVGSKLFGSRFIPLREFIPVDEYLKWLDQIDIAIFGQERQQGMGSTISLLGMGKKVYMRSDVTPWVFFCGLGVRIFDVEQLDLSPLNELESRRNTEIVVNYFSQATLAMQLKRIFK